MKFDKIITPVSEPDASPEVRAIFTEIKQKLQVDEVPLFFRVIARIPLYLETSWRRFQFALLADGQLDRRTKLMAALAVSASNNNKSMIIDVTKQLKKLEVEDAQIAELMAVVDVTNGMNKALKGAGVSFTQ